MVWIEHKYINLLSGRLDRFTRVNTDTYRFRCPLCGDSQKNKLKTRGYVYSRKGNMSFHCHNCGNSMSVSKFIKTIDPTLYIEYQKEKLKEKNTVTPVQEFANKMKTPKYIKQSCLKDVLKVSQLPFNHPCKLYLDSRKIPSKFHYKLFYTSKFKEFVNNIIPNKLSDSSKDEPRLIIPLIDKEENLFGIQGRSLDSNSSIRYITIMFNEDNPRMYGLDTFDNNKQGYCTEGPFDSLFLPNCIASCGGDIVSNFSYSNLNTDTVCVVYDNEPRNKQTIKKIEKAIQSGFSVCIWPSDIVEKDINDMIIKGISEDSLLDIVQKNTFKGLQANIKLVDWKKT